jgi:uracil-DNA glycosylase family 4
MPANGHGQAAPLMVVGDYPSQKELAAGRAFEDGSGQSLKNMLAKHGVKFGELYKTLVLKERPSEEWITEKDKRKKAKIELPSLKDSVDLLLQEIVAIKPRVILACGELSLNVLTGEKGVDKFRGSILPLTKDIQHATRIYDSLAVPIIHPRDLFRQYSAQTYTEFDLGRAIKYTSKRYISPESQYSVWVCRSPRDFRDFLNRCFYKSPYYTTDIETFLGFVTCASLCFDGKEAISVPFMDFKLSPHDRAEFYSLMAKVWSSDKPKLNQNIKYDQFVSEHWGFIYENVFDDTMLLSHSLYPELPKGLDFLTSIYTEIPYYKDEGKEFDPSLHEKDQLYLYNAKDALATWLVYKEQIEDAKTTEIWNGYSVADFHSQRQFPLYDIYRRIDKTGILVDLAQRELLINKYASMLESVETSISSAVGFPYNINSPAQSKEIVYEMLQLPKQHKRNNKGEWTLTTDEEALEELIINHINNPDSAWARGNKAVVEDAALILQFLLTARHLDGGLQWLSIPYGLNNRMYTSTKVTGTESGRTSASRTPLYAWGVKLKGGKYEVGQIDLGMSFQTVPKHGKRLPDGTKILDDLISIFIPDEGFGFLEGDKSQAEARVVVVLSNDLDQLKYFDKPNDVHLLTTAWCTGLDYNYLLANKRSDPLVEYKGKPTKISDLRQDIGKPARHAGNYDMEPPRLSLMAHCPIKEAQDILIKFHEAAPNVRNEFHNTIRTIVTETRTLVNPYGRRRYFFDRITNKYFKEAYAQIPQSTVSDHVKFDILTPMDARWYKEGVRCLNEKHDSLLWLAPISRRDDVGADFISFGKTAINFRNGSFPRDFDLVIPTDLQWSEKSWKEMKELKV